MYYYGSVSAPSNRADWIETVLVSDDDTGDPIDLSTTTINLTVTNARRNPNSYFGPGYGSPYEWGPLRMTGSTTTGEIVVVDLGTFQWTFPAIRMANLLQGEYQIGIRLETADGQIAQLIIGTLTVMEGIDMQ